VKTNFYAFWVIMISLIAAQLWMWRFDNLHGYIHLGMLYTSSFVSGVTLLILLARVFINDRNLDRTDQLIVAGTTLSVLLFAILSITMIYVVTPFANQ
jgi:hypothetical protein